MELNSLQLKVSNKFRGLWYPRKFKEFSNPRPTIYRVSNTRDEGKALHEIGALNSRRQTSLPSSSNGIAHTEATHTRFTVCSSRAHYSRICRKRKEKERSLSRNKASAFAQREIARGSRGRENAPFPRENIPLAPNTHLTRHTLYLHLHFRDSLSQALSFSHPRRVSSQQSLEQRLARFTPNPHPPRRRSVPLYVPVSFLLLRFLPRRQGCFLSHALAPFSLHRARALKGTRGEKPVDRREKERFYFMQMCTLARVAPLSFRDKCTFERGSVALLSCSCFALLIPCVLYIRLVCRWFFLPPRRYANAIFR